LEEHKRRIRVLYELGVLEAGCWLLAANEGDFPEVSLGEALRDKKNLPGSWGLPGRWEFTLAKVVPNRVYNAGSFGFCRTTSSVALKAAKNCVFVGITDLFCVVTGLRVGIVRLHPANP
jgi:hypothetical protein